MHPALSLVAEHPRFIVINKAAGLSFHQEDGVAGLAEQARQLLGEKTLYPVHRLDKLTSGLLLLARDVDSARQLSLAFEQHRIEKRYIALAGKAPCKKQGWIKGDMHKARNGIWRLARSQENPALTWFVSKSLAAASSGPAAVAEKLRLFLLRPYTGKTHQLRVAMKSLGSPIIGDVSYGGRGADRAYLHAWQLAFRLDNENHHFMSPAPYGLLFEHEQLPGILEDWRQLVLPPSPARAVSP